MTYIQDQIREAREVKGLTQADLGRRIGQPQSSISRIERGGDLRVSTLLEMARVLDLEPMLIYKRLIPAVQALMEDTADRSHHSGSPSAKIPPLVGGVPEDAEEENT
jgi:HTH-type transcriptional regulator / antitoxin HipB